MKHVNAITKMPSWAQAKDDVDLNFIIATINFFAGVLTSFASTLTALQTKKQQAANNQ